MYEYFDPLSYVHIKCILESVLNRTFLFRLPKFRKEIYSLLSPLKSLLPTNPINSDEDVISSNNLRTDAGMRTTLPTHNCGSVSELDPQRKVKVNLTNKKKRKASRPIAAVSKLKRMNMAAPFDSGVTTGPSSPQLAEEIGKSRFLLAAAKVCEDIGCKCTCHETCFVSKAGVTANSSAVASTATGKAIFM